MVNNVLDFPFPVLSISLGCLTSEFGMGSGVPNPLWSLTKNTLGGKYLNTMILWGGVVQ